MPIEGYATSDGTKGFMDKALKNNVHPKHFREFQGLIFSSIGMGTYLGEPDEETDKLLEEALKDSLLSGAINVIDTAINYRFQRAERTVGRVLKDLIEKGLINREEVFIATKNGYLTHDSELKVDFWDYIYKEWISKGLLKSNEITSEYHSMSLEYLKDQLDKSLKNLQLNCIDLLYLHNSAEAQLYDISREEYMNKLEKVFTLYEELRREGKIRYYGLATWSSFRVPFDDKIHLNLEDLVKLAQRVGGENHGFKFIQLPFNFLMREALKLKNQRINGKPLSPLEACKILNIGVFTSAPLLQSKLLSFNLPKVNELTKAQLCIQFARSAPILTCLVGQKAKEHLRENLKLAKIQPLSEEEFKELINKI
ncbi:MAG: aldo/keto reductase [Nitrososphaerales archaeon]